MPILSKSLKILVILLLIVPAVRAEENASMLPLRAVVESERNFARAAIERGIRESFLQFFADDSIIFAPEPKNGKIFYTSYEDKGRKLIWQPIFATISSSGEVGVTTGPWELKKSAADQTAIAFGQFVSIWRKQADNSWKVIVDVGIAHPTPTATPGEVQFSLPYPAPNNESEFAKTEERFVKALQVNADAALLDFASDEIRILRDGNFPAVGKEAAKITLGSDRGKMTRKISGAATSAAKDLAWRYGPYSNKRGNAPEQGYYLTIWRIDRGGDWKIIVDLQKKSERK
jgi:ketosteroid isomerase-like protein